MLTEKWDRRFMEVAKLVSTWSKDPGTKVGCAIVDDRRIISTGYNGFPRGVMDLSERMLDREWKLAVTVHAEVNAIISAGRAGAKTEGTTIYTTFPPCSNCASAIIQSGIVRVVCPPLESTPERWRENFTLGSLLLRESGVSITRTL